MKRIYSASADGCINLQKKVGSYTRDRGTVYAEKEVQIKKLLAEAPTAEEIREMLALVGLDVHAFYDLYGENRLKDAVLYAKNLKDRYSVLWIYYDLLGSDKI